MTKPDQWQPDIWTRGQPHARRYPDRWQDKGEWPWWMEAFEGIVGYVAIGVLLYAIFLAVPR